MKVSCTLEKRDNGGCCIYCNTPVEDGHAWGAPYVYDSRGRRHIMVRPCCDTCFAVDAAMAEADDEGRRYTAVVTSLDEDGYDGRRCICGCVKLVRLDFCVQCSRAHRMLDKAAGEARLVNKLLKELRSEIKTKKRELEDQPT